MFDFPSSPSLGQAFYAPNGPVYVWDGVTWQAQPGSAVANVLWSDTAPVAPFNGQLWGNSLTGILYSWYVDPNSSQWVAISGGAPASVKTARTRNRVINPTAQVSQENGTTAMTTNGAYPADQWVFYSGGIVAAVQKSTLATPTPEGTTTSVYMQASTSKPSLAAGDYLQLVLPVEGLDVVDLGWGTAQAKPVVFRFCAVCAAAGTYAFQIYNSAATRSYCGSFTITTANVPQVFSFAVPGDTTGAWLKDTGIGVGIAFNYAAGSTYVGVAGWQAGNKLAPPGCANGAAVAGNGIYITDVGLYSDPDNTGVAPRFEAPSYEDDLARCQRYWQGLYIGYSGYATSGQNFYGFVGMRVLPRVSPSLTGSNAGGVSGFPSTVGTLTSVGSNGGVYEYRLSNGTVPSGIYSSWVTVNARLI